MTPQEIDSFLDGPRIAHFATIDAEGAPRVRPVWYLWRGGTLWFTTSRTRHTAGDLESHPQAAVSIASEDRPYRAVVVHGRPEMKPKDEQTLFDIAGRYGEEAVRRWARQAMAEEDRILLELVPERMVTWDYGRPD